MPRAERRAIKAQVEALNRLIEEEHAKLQSATTAVTTATTTAARSRKSLQDLDGGTVWNRLRSLSEDGDELEGAARDEVEATDEQFAESGKQLGMLQNNPKNAGSPWLQNVSRSVTFLTHLLKNCPGPPPYVRVKDRLPGV